MNFNRAALPISKTVSVYTMYFKHRAKYSNDHLTTFSNSFIFLEGVKSFLQYGIVLHVAHFLSLAKLKMQFCAESLKIVLDI